MGTSAMSGSLSSEKMAAPTDESRSDAEGDGNATGSERGAQPPTMCLTSDEVNYLIFRYVAVLLQTES